MKYGLPSKAAAVALGLVCLAPWGAGCSKRDAPAAGRVEAKAPLQPPVCESPIAKDREALKKCDESNTQFEETVLCLTVAGDRKAGLADDRNWATKEVGGKKCYLKRTSGTKTFHLTTDGVWVDDSCAPADGDSGVISVKYLSDEYYNLLKAKPEMEGYFGIGDKVMVTVGGKTYKIDRNDSK
jgi:hypothetical protein